MRGIGYFALAALLGFNVDVAAGHSLDGANEAYLSFDFDGASNTFDAISADTAATPADREEALRRLALITWRIRGDFSGARRLLDRAAAIGADPFQNALARSRELREAGKLAAAREAGQRALQLANSAESREGAALELGRTALRHLAATPLAQLTAADRAELRLALDALRPVFADSPTIAEIASLTFKLAIRAGDGPLALTAWRSFVRRDSAGMNGTPLADADRILAQCLPAYSGKTSAELVHALIAARFFEEGVLLADLLHLRGAEIADARAYQRFLRAVQASTDRYYQHTAQGRNEESAWQRELEALARAAWKAFAFDDARPAFSNDAFFAEIARRFGAVMNIGQTSGHLDLHMGHAFIDRTERIAQFGRSAELRFVALDWMVSDGYESWVWDGAQAHGGWNRPDVIYQVRPAYSDGPLRRWRALTDPAERGKREARIAAAEADDAALAAKDPAGYLPGVALRLGWLGLNQLLDAQRARYGDGAELKAHFIAAYEESVLRTSIFIHEGRHVLDKREFSGARELQSEELEFRAKLSELEFAENPRLEISSVFSELLGADTPHGRAAHRIVQGMLAWAVAHAAQIKGLDTSRAIQPQLVLLSDEQWHQAAAALDPWANEVH